MRHVDRPDAGPPQGALHGGRAFPDSHKAGDQVKTDKKDAIKLVRLLRAGELTAVHIPDETDEAIRDLCRARVDAIDDLRRAKTRLLAMLRRLGFRYTGKTTWTEAHKRYLRNLRLPFAAHCIIMEELIGQIDQFDDAHRPL